MSYPCAAGPPCGLPHAEPNYFCQDCGMQTHDIDHAVDYGALVVKLRDREALARFIYDSEDAWHGVEGVKPSRSNFLADALLAHLGLGPTEETHD